MSGGTGITVVKAAEAERRSDDEGSIEIGISEAIGGSRSLWLARWTSEPGVRTDAHTHTAEMVALVLRGRAAFTSGDARVELEPGDYLLIPAGVVHSEETIGDETAELVLVRDQMGGDTVSAD